MAIPTLSYAGRLRTASTTMTVVILLGWAVIDILFGPLFVLGAMADLKSRASDTGDRIIVNAFSAYFLLVGVLVFLWGIFAIWAAMRIYKLAPGAFAAAISLIRVAEIGTYASLIVIILFAAHDRAWASHDKIVNYCIGAAFYLILPGLVTLTRWLIQIYSQQTNT